MTTQLPHSVTPGSGNLKDTLTPGASPQKENGYVAIANELIEAMYNTDFSPYETRIALFIARVTYGFNRKTDAISLTQFRNGIKKRDGSYVVRGTGINQRNICRALSRLVSRNIIIKIRDGYITEYGIQKDYTKWLTSDRLTSDSIDSGYTVTTPLTVEPLPSDSGATETSDRTATNNIHKDTITKDRGKTNKNAKAFSPKVLKEGNGTTNPVITAIFGRIKDYYIYPSAACSIDPIPNYGIEAANIKRMLERGISPDDIYECWQQKTKHKKEYCSMDYVNKDIMGWIANNKQLQQQEKKYDPLWD